MYFTLPGQLVVYFPSDNLDPRSSYFCVQPDSHYFAGRPSSHFCVQPDSHYLAGRPSSHFCVQPDSHYFCRTSQPLIFFSVLSALSVPYIVMHSYRYMLFLYQYMYRYVTASNDSDNETTRFHETRCFSLIQTSRVCLVDSNYAGCLLHLLAVLARPPPRP